MFHKQKSNTDSVILDKLGAELVVPIRYSAKAKHIIIKLHSNRIELVVPNKNIQVASDFLLSKEAWVRKKLLKTSMQIRNDSIFDSDNKAIPIFDRMYGVQQIHSELEHIEIENSMINVFSSKLNYNSVLINFLKERLMAEIVKLTSLFSKKYNLRFVKIKIINNKAKWGSCSSKAVLSFNWRLIFVPYSIVEYVVVHEMCHLIEMNHSKNFWNLVSEIYPNYKQAKLWLKENSYKVNQY